MLRFLVPAAFWTASAFAAQAEVPPEVGSLYDRLGMERVLGIMRDEGLENAAQIEADLFPGRGGAAWQAMLDTIYDTDRMEDIVVGTFAEELSGVDLGPLLDFFGSDRGERIVELEVSARKAMIDDSVEEAAEEAATALPNEDPGRHALIETFVTVNDLVESNVMGAMNSNFAFYSGLAVGNAFDGTLTEDEILTDVWSQEAEIRSETELWVYAYLGLAYKPLSDADLEAYIALSETGEGRALNRALFAAFDDLFNDISFQLGRGAAGFMAGEDI
jgi:hypothetical protein